MQRFYKRLPIHVPIEVRVGVCVCARAHVCVTASNYSTPCVSHSCPFPPHPFSTHTKHTHTCTHSNRWLILTEIIRQQSHQHGSVVIRVWTQCLFSSRNGRSAWRKRKEMHYSPWCPDPIQRHTVAPSSLSFCFLLQPTKTVSSLLPQHLFSPLDLILPAFYCNLQLCQMQTSI